MGNQLIYTVLPFDPTQKSGERTLRILDLNEFAQHLKMKTPFGDVETVKIDDSVSVHLFIKTKTQTRWNAAGFIEEFSQFYVNGSPKKIAKELILWYRQFIVETIRLYLVNSESGHTVELTKHMTLRDLEAIFPFSGSDDV